MDAGNADAYILAYALADLENRVIVTYETSGGIKKDRVKIPDVCSDFRLSILGHPMKMFRDLGEKF